MVRFVLGLSIKTPWLGLVKFCGLANLLWLRTVCHHCYNNKQVVKIRERL